MSTLSLDTAYLDNKIQISSLWLVDLRSGVGHVAVGHVGGIGHAVVVGIGQAAEI